MPQLEITQYDTPLDKLWEEMFFILVRPLSEVVEGLSNRCIDNKEIESLIQNGNDFYVEGDDLRISVPENYYHMTSLPKLDGILGEGIRPNSSLHSDKNKPTVFLSYNPNLAALIADSSGGRYDKVLLQIDRNMVNPKPVDHDGNPSDTYASDISIVQLGVYKTVPPQAIIGVYFGSGQDFPKASQIQELANIYDKNAYPINISVSGITVRPGFWNRGIAELSQHNV